MDPEHFQLCDSIPVTWNLPRVGAKKTQPPHQPPRDDRVIVIHWPKWRSETSATFQGYYDSGNVYLLLLRRFVDSSFSRY